MFLPICSCALYSVILAKPLAKTCPKVRQEASMLKIGALAVPVSAPSTLFNRGVNTHKFPVLCLKLYGVGRKAGKLQATQIKLNVLAGMARLRSFAASEQRSKQHRYNYFVDRSDPRWSSDTIRALAGTYLQDLTSIHKMALLCQLTGAGQQTYARSFARKRCSELGSETTCNAGKQAVLHRTCP